MEENSKPRVLLDVDGVLADFVGAFLDVVRAQLGRDHKPEDITSFGLANSLALSKDEFDLCALVVGKPGFCASLDVLPGAVEGVARLQNVADVYIVTSPWNSNPTWTHDREKWLHEHFDISYSRIVHTSAKHLCRGDFLVDDKTETLRRWQAENPGGVAVQWVTPHNRLDGWLGRATDRWDELVAFVDARARLRAAELPEPFDDEEDTRGGHPMKTTYPECCVATDGTARVFYRFSCRVCTLHGEWKQWLSDAEIDGEEHARKDHGEGKAVA